MDVTRAARASLHIVFQVAVPDRDLGHRLARAFGEGRPPQVGVDDNTRRVDDRVQAWAQFVAQTMGSLSDEGLCFGGGFAVQGGLARVIQRCTQRLEGEFSSVLFHQAGDGVHLEKFINAGKLTKF